MTKRLFNRLTEDLAVEVLVMQQHPQVNINELRKIFNDNNKYDADDKDFLTKIIDDFINYAEAKEQYEHCHNLKKIKEKIK